MVEEILQHRKVALPIMPTLPTLERQPAHRHARVLAQVAHHLEQPVVAVVVAEAVYHVKRSKTNQYSFKLLNSQTRLID